MNLLHNCLLHNYLLHNYRVERCVKGGNQSIIRRKDRMQDKANSVNFTAQPFPQAVPKML
jgi:hypothetical protein